MGQLLGQCPSSSQWGGDPKVEYLGTGSWMWCWETSEHKDGGGSVGGLKRGKTKMELATREHDKGVELGGVPGSIKEHLRLVAMNFM